MPPGASRNRKFHSPPHEAVAGHEFIARLAADFERQWVNGFEAIHWSGVGNPRAADSEIMRWAHARGYVVFTHDLGFGILLAHTRAGGPSVVQVRAQDVTPNHLGPLVRHALHLHGSSLETSALITVSEAKSRVRILPI